MPTRREMLKRSALVDLAQLAADGLEEPYRVVVIVTDESGAFVGVGSNTTMGDAQNIMKCALYADGLVFHAYDEEKHSRRGDRRLALAPRPPQARSEKR